MTQPLLRSKWMTQKHRLKPKSHFYSANVNFYQLVALFHEAAVGWGSYQHSERHNEAGGGDIVDLKLSFTVK